MLILLGFLISCATKKSGQSVDGNAHGSDGSLDLQASEKRFVASCLTSHVLDDDPIVKPNDPGNSHQHIFFGNTSTDASSTLANLLGEPTTCIERPGDTAAYWAPTVHVKVGSSWYLAKPRRARFYYTVHGATDPIVAFPAGFEMIAGDSSVQDVDINDPNKQPQPLTVFNWACTINGDEIEYWDVPVPGDGNTNAQGEEYCPVGSEYLRFQVLFPRCGKKGITESAPPPNQTHVYKESGNCPDINGQEYDVYPKLTFTARYRFGDPLYKINDPDVVASGKFFDYSAPEDIKLSSGSRFSGHADFINSWDQTELEDLVTDCIVNGAGFNCADQLTGDDSTYLKDIQASANSDDAEEDTANGTMSLTSDLELVEDGTKDQVVGLRFTGIDGADLPQDSTITNAYIEFYVDEPDSNTTDLTIKGQKQANPATFTSSNSDISQRTQTVASVDWEPGEWSRILREDGTYMPPDGNFHQYTPNISSVIQEILGDSGWDDNSSNNSLAIILSGTGTRTASSFENGTGKAPKLHLIFSEGAPAPRAPIDIAITTGNDDAEERINGTVNRSSTDLQLVNDGSTHGDQHVGMIFRDIDIDPNVDTISKAYIQFTVDEVDTLQTDLTIEGEKTASPADFLGTNSNVSNRLGNATTNSISWEPAGWSVVGESTVDQQTPDIKSIIEEIMNSGGWVSGSSDIAIIITGTGTRTAESYNGDSTKAPVLHIEFQ